VTVARIERRVQYRWYLHWEYGLLRERVRPDGGHGGRTEAWIDIGPPLWHWIDEWAACCASEISEDRAWSLIAERGNGDLYAPDQTEQYERAVYGLDYKSLSEAGRERYEAARREGLSHGDALILGHGHVMLGPVPPVLVRPDDDDGADPVSDADDRH
jgi:hypothetical protein